MTFSFFTAGLKADPKMTATFQKALLSWELLVVLVALVLVVLVVLVLV